MPIDDDTGRGVGWKAMDGSGQRLCTTKKDARDSKSDLRKIKERPRRAEEVGWYEGHAPSRSILGTTECSMGV